ncbi:phosphoribosyltransferase-like protein [Clostridium butyricum]|uniref:phosphoribosyltransferase-like protein n=1 Tax=Clostridium butyricum TaxID=1492 RepID=UPI002ABD813B|nr:uracil phosphoribosyltransferase [Clostridium butyricum]
MSVIRKKIYKKNENEDISSDIMIKATTIFKNNNWNIEDDNIQWKERFNIYCDMLSKLTLEQQNFLLELTGKYLYINNSDYMAELNSLLTNLYKQNYANVKSYNKVYVMPLVAPRDINTVKSSTMLAYLFMMTELEYNPLLKNIQFIRCENKQSIPKSINQKSTSIIFLVDDFIGTGETAIEALDDLMKNNISMNKILVISLVAMKNGINTINKYGVNVFSNKIMKKGISDFYKGNELITKQEIMKSIENKLPINSVYNFGYKGSEALVTMTRTPNNTFPIFWYNNKKKGIDAPFPRRG